MLKVKTIINNQFLEAYVYLKEAGNQQRSLMNPRIFLGALTKLQKYNKIENRTAKLTLYFNRLKTC